MDFIALISTGLAFFAVAVSPGPANLSNATIAMTYGRKTSLIYSLGLTGGLVFWGMIAASGMGAVLQSSLWLLMALKIAGGLYLIWLAFLSVRSAIRPDRSIVVVKKGQRWFMKGLILNMSNPKSVIAWMAALSVGLDVSADFAAVVLATLVCSLVGLTVNILYSLLFSLETMMQMYQRCRRWIDGIVSGLFALAGFSLIRSAFSR